jgi:hypothetical protein
MYAEHRQCPTDGPSTEEMNVALEAIADHFTEAWLTDKTGGHELQCLWRRKDALASIELVTFGSALKSADAIDPAWTGRQIKIMQRSDVNNRRGACFEILGLGYFAPTYLVIPAPDGQPGYDLRVMVTEEYQLRVSLKCYAESTHERNFRKKGEQARDKFLQACSGRSHAVQVLVEALVHPSESEWQMLFAKLIELAKSYNGWPLTTQVDKSWIVSLMPLALTPGEVFSPQHLSYTFICLAPYHQNEQQNFLSKLEGAISNAEKHIRGTDGGPPWIMIRLPPTASSTSLQAWTQEYLNGLSNPKVLCVSFLQPYFVVDVATQTNYVAHHFTTAASPALVDRTRGGLRLVTPFGVPTAQPPLWQLHSSDVSVVLKDRYMHQSGKHFMLAQGNGSDWECNVSLKASGIEQVAVFNPNGQPFVIEGLWCTDLLLIGG